MTASNESQNPQPSPTPRYKNTVIAASETAREMGHSHVGVEHLFLAIIRDPDAIPTGQISGLMDVSQIESNLLALMNSAEYYSTAPAPPDL